MCTAGRVKHHLKHAISDSRNTVLFVGYQAQRSLGRVIQNGTSPVCIFGDWYPVSARIETIEGFSAHADRDELLEWFASLNGVPRRTFGMVRSRPRLRSGPPCARGLGATSSCRISARRRHSSSQA